MSLIEIFEPFPEEDAVGYLRRLACRNGYADWRALVRRTGINPSRNALWKNKAHLTESLELDATWLEQVMPTAMDGVGLHDPQYLRAAVSPVCPACLAQHGYLRRGWQHIFVVGCPEHDCQLLDHCPDCGEALHDGAFSFERCECGYELAYAKTQGLSAIQRFVSARLQGDMRTIDGVAELGMPEDYSLLGPLLFQLAARLDISSRIKPSKIAKPKTIAEALAFLDGTLTLFADWPHAFEVHVKRRIQAGKPTAMGLASRLGHWYMSLHALCRGQDCFAPVWQAFSDAVFDAFDGTLRGGGVLKPSPQKLRTFLPVQEAARELGVSGPTLSSAIAAGEVRARASERGTHYTVAMIERAEVTRVRTSREAWLSESRAAELLGVSETVLENLIRAGLVRVDTTWRSTFLKSGPVMAAGLDELVQRLIGFIEPGPIFGETLTFNDLTARRTLDGKALIALYQAIFEGQIRPLGRDNEHGLGGLLFAANEVKRYLGSAALSSGLTLLQLERATGWKYEAISHWVALRLLDIETVELAGRPARVVTTAALCEFRRHWAPVSELAASVGMSPAKFVSALERRGVQVHGMKDLPNGTRRGGLVAMADLARAIAALKSDDSRFEFA